MQYDFNNIFYNIISPADIQAICCDCGKSNEFETVPFYRVTQNYTYACYDCYVIRLNDVKNGVYTLETMDPLDVNYKYVEYLTYILLNGSKFEKLE